jgi:hypothetical protein
MNHTTKDEMQEASDRLRKMFPQGSTVHTVVRHVSASGMTRAISVLAHEDGSEVIEDVSCLVRRALDWPMDQTHGGVRVKGAGMNMAFHLVYSIAQALYGDGYALSNRPI